MSQVAFDLLHGNQVNTSSVVDDGSDYQEIYDRNLHSREIADRRASNVVYIDQFMDDYRSYIGSMITPSGKVRETPMSKKDAWRAAIDEYRKRKRELNPFSSIESVSDAAGMVDNSESPDEQVSFDILVNKIYDTLEVKDRDYEICRYLSALLYNIDVVFKLNKKTRARVMKYLKTVNIKELGSTDKQMGIALNYEISAGSQCRKLVSIKKRLVERMASIGVTKFDLGK